jgi:hypothetical protein
MQTFRISKTRRLFKSRPFSHPYDGKVMKPAGVFRRMADRFQPIKKKDCDDICCSVQKSLLYSQFLMLPCPNEVQPNPFKNYSYARIHQKTENSTVYEVDIRVPYLSHI